MRLFVLVALTMTAFAANSVLNRAALADGGSGPAAFAAVRLLSGAFCLALLVALRARADGLKLVRQGRWIGVLSLALYILGFSFAYIALDAGTGALILFGGVQITMFLGSILLGDRPPAVRWIGAAIAFSGLVWLLWPAAVGAPPIASSAMMAAAAFGWGIYSLAGRGVSDPLSETAANFILASPLALLAWIILPDTITATGATLAVISGAVTSGLGYALWYSVLPRLDASSAALAQLTVPVIAALGGTLLLAEPPTFRMVLASALVLGGVAFGILAGRQRMSSSNGS